MFTVQDFATMYCCSKRTIEYKIRTVTILFKNFNAKKRKRFYTVTEAKQVIESIGMLPNNEHNRKLTDVYFDLKKYIK